MYKFPEVLNEYHGLRAKGFNPAFEFSEFSNLLSYGYAFGENTENVLPMLRQKEDTMGPITRILFEAGDWPIPLSDEQRARNRKRAILPKAFEGSYLTARPGKMAQHMKAN